MSRLIDADRLKKHYAWWGNTTSETGVCIKELFDTIIDRQPTADVRKNIKAKKVIGGGEHDGETCWFECSSCHGSVDIEDAYCKHCGAVLEYEK